MKKIEIVKKNSDFDKIIRKNQCKKDDIIIIYYLDNEMKKNRFGISVGKKIGNAVVRNYYKRVIRNICDSYKNLYSNGKDYIIILRKGVKMLSYQEIEEHFLTLMKNIKKDERIIINEE